MVDNVAVTAGSGTAIAADEVIDGTLGTVKVQFVKIMDGTLDGTAKATVSASGLAVNTTARSQLHTTGTSNGSIIAPLTLTAGADLASLASGSAVTLSGGTAGVFNQANTGSAQFGLVYFQTVTAGFTPTSGGVISIWWLFTPDASTFETTPATPSTTVPALPRPADCVIPLDAAALGTAALKVSIPCKLPYGSFKVLVQNNSGAAFGAGNYTLKLVAFAENN